MSLLSPVRIAVLGVSAVLAMLAVARHASNSDRFTRAADELALSRQLAGQVAASRASGRQDPAGFTVPELNTWIRDAANAANLADAPGEGITGIEPADPQPLPGTDLGQVLVPIRMEAVDLEETITFLHSLVTNHPQLRVRRISLQSSVQEAGLWSVEAELEYLIPMPRTPADPASGR